MKVLGLLFLGFFLLTACGSQGNAGKPPSKKGLKIVTSFYPIYALVKEISGDQNDIWMVQSGAGNQDRRRGLSTGLGSCWNGCAGHAGDSY